MRGSRNAPGDNSRRSISTRRWCPHQHADQTVFNEPRFSHTDRTLLISLSALPRPGSCLAGLLLTGRPEKRRTIRSCSTPPTAAISPTRVLLDGSACGTRCDRQIKNRSLRVVRHGSCGVLSASSVVRRHLGLTQAVTLPPTRHRRILPGLIDHGQTRGTHP